MRRTALLFSSLFIATGICLAQEQAIDTTEKESQPAEQVSSGESDANLRDPELDQAPDAVKEALLRHTEAQTLKELDVQKTASGNIYQAVYEGQNVETRLRVDENGAPMGMHIAGLGAPINEAAGARRDDTPQQPAAQSQEAASGQPQTAPSQQPAVSSDLRERIQQQLGDETPLLDVQPKVFYQLNIRQNGNVQQVWADETGKVLRDEQQQQQQ